MIKTVLFDLGNVILPFDVMRLANRLTKYSVLSARDIAHKLWSDYVASRFETGKMSPSAYFDHISELCEFKNLTFDEFVPLFNEIFDENPPMVDLISRLKNSYRLGLISNTNAIHAAHIVETYPYLSHFDRFWWSHEAGVRKPDPAIYRMALTHFGAQPSETVFIDDLEENIGSAKKLGINGILYKGVEPLKQDLISLGVSF